VRNSLKGQNDFPIVLNFFSIYYYEVSEYLGPWENNLAEIFSTFGYGIGIGQAIGSGLGDLISNVIKEDEWLTDLIKTGLYLGLLFAGGFVLDWFFSIDEKYWLSSGVVAGARGYLKVGSSLNWQRTDVELGAKHRRATIEEKNYETIEEKVLEEDENGE